MRDRSRSSSPPAATRCSSPATRLLAGAPRGHASRARRDDGRFQGPVQARPRLRHRPSAPAHHHVVRSAAGPAREHPDRGEFTRGGYHRIGRVVATGPAATPSTGPSTGCSRAPRWSTATSSARRAVIVGYECDGCELAFRDGSPPHGRRRDPTRTSRSSPSPPCSTSTAANAPRGVPDGPPPRTRTSPDARSGPTTPTPSPDWRTATRSWACTSRGHRVHRRAPPSGRGGSPTPIRSSSASRATSSTASPADPHPHPTPAPTPPPVRGEKRRPATLFARRTDRVARGPTQPWRHQTGVAYGAGHDDEERDDHGCRVRVRQECRAGPAARGHHVIATTETDAQAAALRRRGPGAHRRAARHHRRRRGQGRRLGPRRAHRQRRRRTDRADGRRPPRPGPPPLRCERVRHPGGHAAGAARHGGQVAAAGSSSCRRSRASCRGPASVPTP